MLRSWYSLDTEEESVDEVSYPSIANQVLRHRNRLRQIAQDKVHWHFLNDIKPGGRDWRGSGRARTMKLMTFERQMDVPSAVSS